MLSYVYLYSNLINVGMMLGIWNGNLFKMNEVLFFVWVHNYLGWGLGRGI